ncbi:MAG: thiamine pyrophosphate-binding protein [Massilimicrobiota sp.]|nr:thiamine pyrophosphate-binding protein [Massilimicrobiota sp.]
METYYTDERNMQMLIYLMKYHGIKKVIASPGSTNITFVASIQQDPYFEIYSCVDERSAAYMACGMAADSGEPVALTCTGATASRNYIPGLTEAYYRKLPILAITATQHIGRIGHNVPQVIDRTNPLNDICVYSATIQVIHDKEDEWAYSTKINEALLELKHHGGGPVHLNMVTENSVVFDVKKLPITKVIDRITLEDQFPSIKDNRVGIFVGNHPNWDKQLTTVVDQFCEQHNAVVICDHTSNYNGKYKVMGCLITAQKVYNSPLKYMDILIDLGNVSGASIALNPKEVWRINPDGKIRDRYKKMRYIFEMNEIQFFKYYINEKNNSVKCTYYEEWRNEYNKLLNNIPKDIPFSNIWIAKNTIKKLPENSKLHLGILNSLRAWNFFDKPDSIEVFSNTGGFGIDGVVSTFLGSSLVNPDTLYFCVVGDLAYFYDLNATGNRHRNNNLRILVINNGKGTEFKNYNSNGAKFGEATDEYIAAARHYGNQSKDLVRHYSQDLGFKYISATNKEEYLKNLNEFINSEITDRSILFEVFTHDGDESNALYIMNHLESDLKGNAKSIIKKAVGQKGINKIKKFIKG